MRYGLWASEGGPKCIGHDSKQLRGQKVCLSAKEKGANQTSLGPELQGLQHL